MAPHDNIKKRLLYCKKIHERDRRAADIVVADDDYDNIFSDDDPEGFFPRIERERQSRPSALAAAKYFNFDISNPHDREFLFYILADVVFGKEHSGRPRGKKWDDKKLVRLGKAYDSIKRKNPEYRDSEIAKLIYSRHKEFQSAETTRQQLPEARKEFADSLRRTDPNYWWPGVKRREWRWNDRLQRWQLR
jgi:hypothetical protein